MDSRQEKGILLGKTIICTYPKKEHDDFSESISSMGAKVLSLPMIEISPVSFTLKNDISYYHWLIFTSKSAIPIFFNNLKPTGSNKMAVLGESTANELRRFGYIADFVGSGKSAMDFGDELSLIIKPGENILLVLGTLAPDVLQQKLAPGNPVERVNVYQTTIPREIDRNILSLIKNNQYDLLIVSSPSAIRNLCSILKSGTNQLRIISIGQTTSAAVLELKMKPLATAKDSSYKGLAEITLEYFKQDHKSIHL